jgi:multiple antibiotic resistance protein
MAHHSTHSRILAGARRLRIPQDLQRLRIVQTLHTMRPYLAAAWVMVDSWRRTGALAVAEAGLGSGQGGPLQPLPAGLGTALGLGLLAVLLLGGAAGAHAAAGVDLPHSTLNDLPAASAFEAQAKLLPRLRQFYGGAGYVKGLLPILMLMVGPLKVIPAFLKLTARAEPALRRRMAWYGFLLSSAMALVLALFGYQLLDKFNIPLTAILASAGLVLVLVALRLVLAQYGDGDDDPDHPQASAPPAQPGLDLVMQPLVFPVILTPYGLATLITLSAVVRQVEGSVVPLLSVLMAIMVLNLLAMLFARPILLVLRPNVLQMLGLVLGIVQLALGIALLSTAVEVQALTIRELLR